jgi:D-alanyl-D-alanine carboxypeptidase (penicillin-binding protein 5/6)
VKLRHRLPGFAAVALALSLALTVAAIALAPPALAAAPLKSSPVAATPTSGIAGQSAAGTPATQPRLTARAAILVEESTGQVLYASNANAELAIASTTKLMTALLTLEHVRHLSAMFAAPDYYAAPGDSQIGLVPRERMSVHDLLLALLIPSADDAAEDLAYNVGERSVARFIGMMNARARELGLAHTHYSTPSGLDTPGNYSSAADLVKLSIYLLEHHPWLRHVVGLSHARLRTGRHPRSVISTDTLLSEVPWINGVKTGHTGAAGYVLVGSGTRDGITLVSAVLGTASEAARDSSTLALLGHGFANFRLERPVVSGSVVARPSVSDSPGVRVPVLALGTVSEMVARAARLTIRVDVPHQLTGPLRVHTVVGSVVVSSGARVLARVPVVLSRSLPAVSEFTIAGRFLVRPTTLVLLVLLIGGASVLGRRRRGGWRAVRTGHTSGTTVLDSTSVTPADLVPRGAAGSAAGKSSATEGASALDKSAAVQAAVVAAGAATATDLAPVRDPAAVELPDAAAAGLPDAVELPDAAAAGLQDAAAAVPDAAAERERRRAEREARRRAAKGGPAQPSARDRA